MKKMILSVIVLFAVASVFAQNQNDRYYSSNNYNAYSNTPSKVQRGWESYHPTNTSPSWSKEGNRWHAHYTDRSTNRNADEYYNKRGKMIDSHREWSRKDLPGSVDNRIWDRYHTRSYNVTRIDRPHNSSLFQISLNLGIGNARLIYMDEQGNEVKYRDRH